MNTAAESSQEIVRRSGSNLAFALAVLPRHRRDDMRVFYAFCRIVDDIADASAASVEEKRDALERWRQLALGDAPPRPGLETEFTELRERRGLDSQRLAEIVDGVERDLSPQRFDTAAELERYCYLVAGAVGLVSIEIFGCERPESRDYAEQLGYALQWTNILRDVGEDAGEGRLYLPRESLERFDLGEEEILGGRPDRERFLALMRHETERARAYYRRADGHLTREDRPALRSAELMRRIYTRILDTMEADRFRVYEKRYHLSKTRMLAEFLRAKFLG